MNVYDSLMIKNLLRSRGFVATDEMKEADLIILNTCHIREKAAEKIYSELGRVKLIKDEKKLSGLDLIVAVTGCVAQAEGEEIFKQLMQVAVL